MDHQENVEFLNIIVSNGNLAAERLLYRQNGTCRVDNTSHSLLSKIKVFDEDLCSVFLLNICLLH